MSVTPRSESTVDFFFLSGTFVVESFRWSLSEPGKCLETAAGQQSWTDTQDAKRVVCWSTTCVKSPQTSSKGALIRATSYQANLSRQRRSSLLLSEPSGTFPAGFQPPWSLKIKNSPQKNKKNKKRGLCASQGPSIKSLELDLTINLLFLLAIQLKTCNANVRPVVLQYNLCLLSSNSQIAPLPYVSR